jgi:hypothetical protein
VNYREVNRRRRQRVNKKIFVAVVSAMMLVLLMATGVYAAQNVDLDASDPVGQSYPAV